MHREAPLWAEFRDLIEGLLQITESRLWRATRPDTDDTPPQE